MHKNKVSLFKEKKKDWWKEKRKKEKKNRLQLRVIGFGGCKMDLSLLSKKKKVPAAAALTAGPQ